MKNQKVKEDMDGLKKNKIDSMKNIFIKHHKKAL